MKSIALFFLSFIWVSFFDLNQVKPLLDIQFIMERDGEENFDIRMSPLRLKYGEEKKTYTFSVHQRGLRYQLISLPQIQDGHRSLKLSLCIYQEDSYRVPLVRPNCELSEELEFQFEPNQEIIVSSLEDPSARYNIVVKERLPKTNL